MERGQLNKELVERKQKEQLDRAEEHSKKVLEKMTSKNEKEKKRDEKHEVKKSVK